MNKEDVFYFELYDSRNRPIGAEGVWVYHERHFTLMALRRPIVLEDEEAYLAQLGPCEGLQAYELVVPRSGDKLKMTLIANPYASTERETFAGFAIVGGTWYSVAMSYFRPANSSTDEDNER